MSNETPESRPHAAPERRALGVALAVTLTVQSLTSMAMIAPSVLAPVAAIDLGVAPQTIGLFVSACYLAAMLSGLACGGLIARYGAFAMCMASVALAGLGLGLGALALLVLLPLSAAFIGTGYGFVNPVSSHVLARATPPRMMSLVFSVKQTGVPIGGAVAGALVPPLLLAVGWKPTLVLLGFVCLAAALPIEPARRRERLAPAEGASGRPEQGRLGLGRALAGLGAPIRLVATDARLRELAMLSFAFATVQLGLFTYLVLFLNLELGFSLVAAGLVFSAAQTAGIAGRILWGATADRWIPPRAMLGVLGLAMAASGLATALWGRAWPLAAVVGVAIAFGASAVGWNGVYLAEVARRAPRGNVGAATGGTQFFTFLGALSGPPLFGWIAGISGSYAWGFAAFSVLPFVIGARLLILRPGQGAA